MKSNNKYELKKFLKNIKLKKIFILAGKKSFKKTKAEKILKSVIKDKKVFFYFKKNYYPVLNEINKIIKSLESIKPDLIIAIGGGSVIDYAKIANVSDIKLNLKNLILNSDFHLLKKKYKLIVIPTTAGSGAEVTSNAVLYINKKKFSLESDTLIPNKHFLIPELVMSAKKSIKSSAGFDAIAQSLESIISVKATKKSITYAQKSLRLAFRNFLAFVNKPNIINTQKMCLAANFAGKAINITKTTAPHALSYPFTAHFGVSHGHAVSLTINEFLKFNYEFNHLADPKLKLRKKFNLIFKIAKVKNISQLDNYLSILKSKANLQQNFKKLNINIKRNLNLIISGVNLLRLKNNPIKLNKHIIKNILFDAAKKR